MFHRTPHYHLQKIKIFAVSTTSSDVMPKSHYTFHLEIISPTSFLPNCIAFIDARYNKYNEVVNTEYNCERIITHK